MCVCVFNENRIDRKQKVLHQRSISFLLSITEQLQYFKEKPDDIHIQNNSSQDVVVQ